jgi:hypothetical protein
MKNLIFVALLVSVMLVLSVGSAFAGFTAGEGDTRTDRAQEAAGSSAGSGEVESGGESGGSGGPIVVTAEDGIARFDDSALSLRNIE